MKRILLLAFGLSLAGSAAQSQMNPAQLSWGLPPPGLPAGARLAVLSGDPNKEGMFTIRLRFPPGYAVRPHWHPTDELVTVINGQIALGMGSTFVRTKAKTLVAGGYVALPAKMHHYAFTRTGTTIQITAHGPFQITYVDPKNDPRLR